MVKQYKRDTLENFYLWQGHDVDPDIGTVNQLMGYNMSAFAGSRYSKPLIHKNSTVTLDFTNESEGMPVEGTIEGVEKDVIWPIDSHCPPSKIPNNLLTQEEFDVLNWVNNDIDEFL